MSVVVAEGVILEEALADTADSDALRLPLLDGDADVDVDATVWTAAWSPLLGLFTSILCPNRDRLAKTTAPVASRTARSTGFEFLSPRVRIDDFDTRN
jgi:hypothetical protein